MKHFDFVVIGGGPAGQKAAIQAAKAGKTVAIIEREAIGGECVFRGTIPSKSLRQTAMDALRKAASLNDSLTTPLPKLLGEVRQIIAGHSEVMGRQILRNKIDALHGVARFESANQLCVELVGGERIQMTAEHIVIATGSVPRQPKEAPVDHEHIIDSDSILSLAYLPETLIVLGGGVIACEYASILSMLGVKVTMLDRNPRPLLFMDEEVVQVFVDALRARGGDFIGGAALAAAEFDGISQVEVKLVDGRVFYADKVFCAMGRMARVQTLNLAAAGLAVNERGILQVNRFGQTSVPHIYAAGDVVGPPSLASASMEQGRLASRHALGLTTSHDRDDMIPSGIYAVPELASIGLNEAEARAKFDDVCVGRARFEEIARGQISNVKSGILKLVARRNGRVLGVHIVGDGATELVHIGQLAMLANFNVETFIDHVFNFPTLAEAYRVAALSMLNELVEGHAQSQTVGVEDEGMAAVVDQQPVAAVLGRGLDPAKTIGGAPPVH